VVFPSRISKSNSNQDSLFSGAVYAHIRRSRQKKRKEVAPTREQKPKKIVLVS